MTGRGIQTEQLRPPLLDLQQPVDRREHRAIVLHRAAHAVLALQEHDPALLDRDVLTLQHGQSLLGEHVQLGDLDGAHLCGRFSHGTDKRSLNGTVSTRVILETEPFGDLPVADAARSQLGCFGVTLGRFDRGGEPTVCATDTTCHGAHLP